MTPAPPDGVQIDVTFDSVSYQAPTLPPQTHPSISVDQLASMAGAETWATIGEVLTDILNPVLGVAISQGIKTDSYTLPPNWQPPYPTPLTLVDVAQLSGAISVTVKNQQPYPLIGDIFIGTGF